MPTKTRHKLNTAATTPRFSRDLEQRIEWIGGVNSDASANMLAAIKTLQRQDPAAPIELLITSAGGATGVGLGFYDTIRSVLKPNLTTIAAGDCDSSGIIIFLSGARRVITKNTTMLLHLAGRTFKSGKRYTTLDMEAMLREDKLKDYQYASVVAENSNAALTPEAVLDMMARNTVLTPTEALHFGLAHEIAK